MKKILLISLLLFSKIVFSQINDSFSDGDFSQNPVWNGDLALFQVNAQKQIQSNGAQLASQTIALSTANHLSLNASWEFLVQLNFDPTTTNFVRVYLTSSQEDLKANLNGYFVQIGETGANDGFHLYKQSGTTTSRIIAGPPKPRSNANIVMARIKVTRNALGNWDLFTDVTGGTNYQLEGSVTDNTFITSAYSGIFCRYATASRYNQYIFDDFLVDDLVPDVIPPKLTGIKPIDSYNLELTFSEPLTLNSATQPSNYNLSNGYGSPISISNRSALSTYQLTFVKELISGSYRLDVGNVMDLKGNLIQPNSSVAFTYIKPYLLQQGDVVINEIFANPTGSPSLPQKEFVEIWNTTTQYILTQGWKYADQTSTYTFGIDTIRPNQHVILTAKADENLFSLYGKTIGLSPWPSLNNDKDILTLTDATGKVIDRVVYNDTWYKDDLKKKGGYSLELIDPENLCKGTQNWLATIDNSGGTPGKENAVYRSQISIDLPKLLTANIIDSVTVEIVFSKAIDSLSAVQPTHYFVNNGVGNPSVVVVNSTNFNGVSIKFNSALSKGIENVLTIQNVTDCAGNVISSTSNTAKLFMAKNIEINDILISEVLFNPRPGSVDFVEIYNNSNHVLDVKELQLANLNVAGNVANIKNLSGTSLLIPPKSYWVVSTNTESIKTNYFCQNPDQFIQLTALPVYNNDKGTVILWSNNKFIDRLDYNEKMHVQLLRDPDGVSLERVSFLKGTNDAKNFKSAAGSVGFASPTYKNTQEPEGELSYATVLKKTFSPDNDGLDDLLQLDYQLNENASFATINIYSDKGVLVRTLLKNQSIGTKGSLFWDGLNDAGQKAAIGIYIVLFDVFDLNGNTRRFKNTCVLAAQLN